MKDLRLEFVEMNYLKISSEDGETEFYDLSEMEIGDAVEKYLQEN